MQYKLAVCGLQAGALRQFVRAQVKAGWAKKLPLTAKDHVALTVQLPRRLA